jgi:micrococcal nuclease
VSAGGETLGPVSRRLAAAAAVLLLSTGVACSRGARQPVQGVQRAGAPAPPMAAFGARVERVVDGDTVIARVDGRPERMRVRIVGIDAPESVTPDAAAECYGRQAASYVDRLVQGSRVVATYQDGPRQDRFGRELWDIWLEDGSFVAGLLVEQGYARTLTIRPQVAHSRYLAQLEGEARQAGRGLWGPACPTAQ